MNQPLAYVHPGAKIAKNVVIEPFTTIHNNVVIGEGTWIGSNVTIMEGARIGKNCNIFPGAVISAIPQDLKYNDEDTTYQKQQQLRQAPMIQEVCDLLRSHQAHATFFVCTDYTTPEQAQHVLQEGHELGNHLERDVSWYYSKLSELEFARVVDETNAILQSFLMDVSFQDRQTKIMWANTSDQ